jgi:hypothetical protein
MKTPCIEPEDLARVDEVASNHPVRSHLEECARCRARHSSYRSFVGSIEAGPTPAADRLGEARVALDSLIDRQFGHGTGRQPVEMGMRKAARRLGSAFRRRRWAWALAPAACAVLVIGYLTLGPDSRSPGTIVLRGSGASMFRIDEPLIHGDGSILLRWRSVPAANSYRVQLLDAGLRLKAEVPVGNDTALVLPRDQVVRHGPKSQILWRVAAYSGSRRIAESEVGTFTDR